MPESAIECTVAPGTPATVEVPAETMDDTVEWFSERRDALRRSLWEHGAVYFKGLPVTTVEDFGRIRDAVTDVRASYREKATPRSAFGDDVYSSTDFPPSERIRLHNENSYTLTYPGMLLFCCLEAAEQGGATPVADVRQVLAALPDDLVSRFRTSGWGLSRAYRDAIGLNWRTAFGTEDPEDVANYCARNLIDHAWSGNVLHTTQRRSAIITHPETRDEVWFNHVSFWSEWSLDKKVRDALVKGFGQENLPFNTSFGDGTSIGPEEIHEINAAYASATVLRRWQPGDLMIVDNILAAHGRQPYVGARKILVAMGDPIELAACAPTVEPTAAFGISVR